MLSLVDSPASAQLALDPIASITEDRELLRFALNRAADVSAIRSEWLDDALAIQEAGVASPAAGACELARRFRQVLVLNDGGDEAVVLVHRGGAA